MLSRVVRIYLDFGGLVHGKSYFKVHLSICSNVDKIDLVNAYNYLD